MKFRISKKELVMLLYNEDGVKEFSAKELPDFTTLEGTPVEEEIALSYRCLMGNHTECAANVCSCPCHIKPVEERHPYLSAHCFQLSHKRCHSQICECECHSAPAPELPEVKEYNGSSYDNYMMLVAIIHYLKHHES